MDGNEFFTVQSLGTFAGTVGTTTVVTNGIQRAFAINPKWMGLAIAEVTCVAVVAFAHASPPAGSVILESDYFIAIINGFLVYLAAAGATAAAASAAAPPAAQGAVARGIELSNQPRPRTFFRRWL
jgi:hypothetical protein